MELAVPLPLSGRALVEIRRSRAVVIAPGESCFDYGPFSSILVRPNPFLVGGHTSDAILGTWGGVTLHVGKASLVCIISSSHILTPA